MILQIITLLVLIAALTSPYFLSGLVSSGKACVVIDTSASMNFMYDDNQTRLDKAKELMEEGFTVKDAADKVGFATPRPLIRCFREKYGTTPGDYYKYK